MSDCNAKFTSAEVTDEAVANLTYGEVGGDWVSVFVGDRIPDGVAVQRQGDRLVRVDLHTLECFHGEPERWHTSAGGMNDTGARWSDDTPGATPHADDVTVSDAEVEAAREAYLRTAESGHPSDTVSTGEAMREAILAAKRAERKQG